MGKYAVVLGGELRNRGAQAMSFLTISNIRKLLPGIEPVLVSPVDAKQPLYSRVRGRRTRDDLTNLSFKVIWGGLNLLPLNGCPNFREKTRDERFREFVMQCVFSRQLEEGKTVLEDAALCIDVSGFQFGAQWGYGRCSNYLREIALLRERDIPTYILPQSFGPFDFADFRQTEIIRSQARELLRFPRMICARERQGYSDILDLCPGARCTLEEDMVLQAGELDVGDIFIDPSKVPEYPRIETERNVAIIPNARTFDHGDGVRLLALYGSIVDQLLRDGYNVYVIRHSEDDDEACSSIKGMFMDEGRVTLMCEERYCFQYEKLFARCDFLVASRFHSIVHAYRRGVPCVALGWAMKYAELLGRFGQGRYVHDARSLGDEDALAVFASVKRMEARHAEESEAIKERLSEIRRGASVFERVAEDYAGLVG